MAANVARRERRRLVGFGRQPSQVVNRLESLVFLFLGRLQFLSFPLRLVSLGFGLSSVLVAGNAYLPLPPLEIVAEDAFFNVNGPTAALSR